jgi:hypothetical protein
MTSEATVGAALWLPRVSRLLRQDVCDRTYSRRNVGPARFTRPAGGNMCMTAGVRGQHRLQGIGGASQLLH